MNIKYAIYHELLTIPKFFGKISTKDIHYSKRPESSVDLNDPDRDLSIVYYRVTGTEDNSVKNNRDIFQFDIWADRERYADLEEAKNIMKDWFHQFQGNLGGGLMCRAQVEQEGDKEDIATGESGVFLRIAFHYIRPTAGTIS